MLFLFCFLLPSLLVAQTGSKIDNLPFCGWTISSKKGIRKVLEEQFNFLSPQKGDTIVDIGAASGSFEGCLAAGFDLADVDFILVDVNTLCLNETKVANMRRYYSAVKGDSIRNQFQIVINTQDSLYLPTNRYRKVWLLNTLHEVASPKKMARDLAAVVKSGGELYVLETLPKKEGQLHGGCNKPLLKPDEIIAFFLKAGFRVAATKELTPKKKFAPVMYRFVKDGS